MAKDNIDGILVRLDEIEKLQTELRHLVPRVASNSSRHVRHQNLSRDSSTSIVRFPSLFTFPVITDFTSSPKNERVQKSAAQLNLSNKLSSGNRSSTVNLKNAGRSSPSGSSARETNIFKNLLKGSNNVKSHVKNSLASTSVIDSNTSMMLTRNIAANRKAKHPQEVIRKGLKNETSKVVARGNAQRVNGDKSNTLFKIENNVNSIYSSVQTSDIQVHAAETTNSHSIWSRLERNRCPDRSPVPKKTFIKRVMEKLNYYFLDNKRVTVPCHYPGSRTPTRVSYSPIERLFATKIFVN